MQMIAHSSVTTAITAVHNVNDSISKLSDRYYRKHVKQCYIRFQLFEALPLSPLSGEGCSAKNSFRSPIPAFPAVTQQLPLRHVSSLISSASQRAG